jgi:hypothetical protein
MEENKTMSPVDVIQIRVSEYNKLRDFQRDVEDKKKIFFKTSDYRWESYGTIPESSKEVIEDLVNDVDYLKNANKELREEYAAYKKEVQEEKRKANEPKFEKMSIWSFIVYKWKHRKDSKWNN